MTTATDGLGRVTTWSNYNALGEAGKVVGPNGVETDYTWDARGRQASQTEIHNGVAATWTYAYDGYGLLSQVTEPDGEVTTSSRDADMRVIQITRSEPEGNDTETIGYDAMDDVTSDVVTRGSVVARSSTNTYDGYGRLYQAMGNNGQRLTYAYDGNSNVLSVTDALGHVSTLAYDALNRVVSFPVKQTFQK